MNRLALLLGLLLSTTGVSLTSHAAPAALAAVTPKTSCESLRDIDLSGIGGAGSQVLTAATTQHNEHDVCAVEGRLAPSIGFQVLLPLEGWTQRYLQVGCGGLCGRISLQVGAADGCVPLEAGEFVLASTDMGHQDQDGRFGRDTQQRADFAHRGVHLTAQAAQALIQAFYGQAPAYRYFTGCSDGGREALMEAQRYPDDFDGIIAGAAALNFQVQNGMYHAWQARANTGADGKAILLAEHLPVLHRAVLEQCDALDGQKDALLADPRACDFDPTVVRCVEGQATEHCLTPAEVEVARRLYDGPRDPDSGERLTVGGPLPGSELAWAGVFVPRDADQPLFSEKIALGALTNLVFEQPPEAGFSLSDMRFDTATFDRLRTRHALFDATNPDLSRFAASGGKLIIWHGWSDPHISPLNSVAYYEALQAQMGKERADAFSRLYLLPGVYHCSGGDGPSQLDLLTPMLAWVESGTAPDAIVARQPEAGRGPSGFGAPTAPPADRAGAGAGAGAGAEQNARPPRGPMPMPALFDDAQAKANAGRTRPVFPYPEVARYSGQGDPKQAGSYIPAAPLIEPEPVLWRGQDFFKPYSPLTE
ncbi:tannase/feruloyl esterase family alpha/beta hydrolase [Stutzerimonas chloritidismutans]|uniref:tannase/feruloyl esterase family alpha/beta hydrolase n=1 Tax=Stutzerimonas chloritidismutans TaxID=203192 RepID=UPI003F17BDFC